MRRYALLTTAVMLIVGLVTPIAVAEAPGPQITAVTPDSIIPEDDFASLYRGFFWDFSSPDHFGWETSQAYWDAPTLTTDGWFTGTTTPLSPGSRNTDASIRLNNFTEPGTIPVPGEYADFPFFLPFRYLTVRMCATFNDRSVLAGREPNLYTYSTVSWHRDAAISNYEWGVTNGVKVYEGCRMYIFDLETQQNTGAAGKVPWSEGGFTGLRLRPATHTDVTVEIDYATLTAETSGTPATVNWEDNGRSVRLLMDTSATMDRATQVSGSIRGGSFVWNTPNLVPGTYHLALEQDGELNQSGSLVVNGPPRGRILTPSFTSGPEYTDLARRGDNWDMDGPGDLDIDNTRNVQDLAFGDGLFSAVNIPINGVYHADPGIHLDVNRTQPIDPDRFFYLTYRMWLQDPNEPAPSFGNMVRWLWWTGEAIGDKFASTTQDIRDYDGWQQFSVDMRTDVLEHEAPNIAGAWGDSGPIYFLRLDPHESNLQTPVVLDWVKLTGDHYVDQRIVVSFEASDPEGDPLDIRLYYDTDDDWRRGRTRFKCGLDEGADTTSCAFWTWRLEPGEYYIHMKMVDTAGNVTWVTSEVPIIVEHFPMTLTQSANEVDTSVQLTWDPAGADPAEFGKRYFYGPTARKSRTKTFLSCAPTADPLTCEWDTTNVPDGTHWVYLRLRNPFGNLRWVYLDQPIVVNHSGG